jgi:hypothetical protein
MFLVLKNQITKHTSQLAGLLIDMVLSQALSYSNQFTQWFEKRWGHDRTIDNSS